MLGDVIRTAQKLNGVQKNKLEPQGTQRQNEFFKNRLINDKYLIEDKVKLIRCGLSVVQDSKTGLYKLCIDNKLYDIPERKVEIGVSDTDFGEFPIPEIVD